MAHSGLVWGGGVQVRIIGEEFLLSGPGLNVWPKVNANWLANGLMEKNVDRSNFTSARLTKPYRNQIINALDLGKVL